MSVEFKSVVVSVLGADPLSKLDSSNREESLACLVRTCKQNDLEKRELNPAKLIKLTMSNLKNNEANRRWQEQVLTEFERQIELVYSPVIPAKSHEEAYKEFMLDTKNRERRKTEFDKLRATKTTIGKKGQLSVGDLMDLAMNNTEDDFNKLIEVMEKV